MCAHRRKVELKAKYGSLLQVSGPCKYSNLDDSGSSLLDSGDEIALQPLIILYSFLDGGPPNTAVRHIRELRG